MYKHCLYIPDGKMAAPGGRSLEVPAEVEALSTNSHLGGEDSGEFLTSKAIDNSKLDRFRGLFQRRKKKNDGEENETVTKNRPYGEISV